MTLFETVHESTICIVFHQVVTDKWLGMFVVSYLFLSIKMQGTMKISSIGGVLNLFMRIVYVK